MFCTIISDCTDDNAFGRQAARIAALFGSSVTTITPPIGVMRTMHAAGNLVDVLDATHGAKGIVMVNVAPRDNAADTKGLLNGAQFGYFFVRETMVISTIDKMILSLVNKLGIIEKMQYIPNIPKVHLLDIPTVMEWAVQRRLIERNIADRVIHSQFRSFEFLPRAALWLHQQEDIPAQATDIFELAEYPEPMVWWIDNFDNCKTTLLYEELEKIRRSNFRQVNDLPFYPHLEDVPQGTLAWVIGSSGFGDDRFLEIVLKGGRAAHHIGEFLAWSISMSS